MANDVDTVRARQGAGRRAAAAAGIAVLALAVAALLAWRSADAVSPKGSTAPRYLFSVPAAAGSLTGPDDGHLTLRLTGARDYLTRFTDRPFREAFVVADVDFARRFARDFAGSSPNAVLTYTPTGERIPTSIVLTIGRPRWDAGRSAWTLAARRIRKRPDNLPGSTVRITPPAIPNPHRFAQATLLIDDSIDNGEQGG